MDENIHSRLQKLLKREAITNEQLQELEDLLKGNGAEIESLMEELRSLIGTSTRPTYLIDTWKDTIDKVPQLLSSATAEEEVKRLVDKGE